RAAGRRQQHGRCRQAQGGDPPDGREQQGFQPLPVLIGGFDKIAAVAMKLQERPVALERIRNIGIMAHIDAGKTTTTERILIYAGRIHKMGEVHEGAATMDWMVQEKQRALTITSAATAFTRLGARAVAVQLPIGSEDAFKGVVDLINQRTIIYTDDLGANYESGEIPAELKERVEQHRHDLIEAVADYDDEVMHKYLEEQEV